MGISFPLSETVKQAFVCVYWEGIHDKQCEAFASHWAGLDLEHFQKALEEGTGEEKLLAIFALGLTATREVADLLAPLVDHAPRRERWASAICLGLMHDPRALPVLESLLLDGLDFEEYLHAYQADKNGLYRELCWCEGFRWHVIELLKDCESSTIITTLKQTYQALWNIQQHLPDPFWLGVSNYDALAYVLGRKGDLTLAHEAYLPRAYRNLAMIYLALGQLRVQAPGFGVLTGLPSDILNLYHELQENDTLQQMVTMELSHLFGLSSVEREEILAHLYKDTQARENYSSLLLEERKDMERVFEEGEEDLGEGVEEEEEIEGKASLLCAYKEHTARIYSLAWSPESTHLISGSEDTTARVWEYATGKTVTVFRGHSASVNLVAWSPQDRLVASGGSDQMVYVWDAWTGEKVQSYRGHHSWIWGGLAWSPDGKWIASASLDRTIHVWDALSGEPSVVYRGHTGVIASLAWSPDGTRIVSGGGYPECSIQVWDAQTGALQLTYQDHQHDILKQRPLTKFLGENLDEYEEKQWRDASSVHGLVWLPDGKWIASAGSHYVYRVWNAQNGKNRFISMRSEGPLALTPDGTRLASPIFFDHILFWQVATDQTATAYYLPGMFVSNAFSLSSKGNMFAVSAFSRSLCEKEIVQVWKMLTD